MGGTQSRVEEHDSTPSEAEKSVPEVKLSNGFLARLEERSQAGSLIGERSPETPPENVLLDEDHIQQQRDAQAARAQQVCSCYTSLAKHLGTFVQDKMLDGNVFQHYMLH